MTHCHPPCNEASLQHLAQHTKVAGCSAFKATTNAKNDFKFTLNTSVLQYPVDSLQQRSAKVEWSLANQQQECIGTPKSRYPVDRETFSSRRAIQAVAPLTPAYIAQHDTPTGMHTDRFHAPTHPGSTAVRMCTPSVFTVVSKGPSVPCGKGVQYPGQAHSINESSFPNGRDHMAEGPLHHQSAMKYHVQAGGHTCDTIKYAVSSAVCKADEVLKSLRGNWHRYSEIPLREAAALATTQTPALRRPQEMPQPSQFWKGRYSTPRPGTAPVASSPAVTAATWLQADCTKVKSGAPACMQRPGPCQGAHGTYGSRSPAPASILTVNRAREVGEFATPATSAVGVATPWAETLRSKLRQLRADRASTPKRGGSKFGHQVCGCWNMKRGLTW